MLIKYLYCTGCVGCASGRIYWFTKRGRPCSLALEIFRLLEVGRALSLWTRDRACFNAFGDNWTRNTTCLWGTMLMFVTHIFFFTIFFRNGSVEKIIIHVIWDDDKCSQQLTMVPFTLLFFKKKFIKAQEYCQCCR